MRKMVLALLGLVLVAPSFAKSVDDICIEDSAIADQLLQPYSKAVSILNIPEITDAERQSLVKLSKAARAAIITAQVDTCNSKTPVEALAAWKRGMSIAMRLNAEEMERAKILLADAYRKQASQRQQEEKK